MYRFAPVNAAERYNARVQVGDGRATVAAPVQAGYCHAAGALHGSSYFKMLDDAAFFAAQSTIMQHMIVTTSFTTYLTRPVVPSSKLPGLIAKGQVISASSSLILADAVVCTPDGSEVGRGSGTFMPHPKFLLGQIAAYSDDELHPFTSEDRIWA